MLIQVINFPENCVTFLKEYLKILAFNFLQILVRETEAFWGEKSRRG